MSHVVQMGKHEKFEFLPGSVLVDVDSSDFESTDELEEYLSDLLSDEYGFCHGGYKYEVSENGVLISNIDWDVDEEGLSEDDVTVSVSDLLEDAQDRCSMDALSVERDNVLDERDF